MIEKITQYINNLNLIKIQTINNNQNYCKIELEFLRVRENGIINYPDAYVGRLFIEN